MYDLDGFEPLADIVARLVDGLTAETGRQPKGTGDRNAQIDRRSTAAGGGPAAILQFVGKDRSIRAAASLGGKQKDKERARMTATSGRAPATPADHVAAGS